MKGSKALRATGFAVLALGAAAALGVLIVRDQIARHRRDLFNSHPLRRLAALGYLAGRDASVEVAQLLRDFIAWEPRPLLRRRALHILDRLEERLAEKSAASHEVAG